MKRNNKLWWIGISVCLAAIVSIFVWNNFKTDNKKDILKIGVLQFVEHEALDASRNGFIDGLSELGFKDGENIKIDYKNAQSDQSNCNLIANQFVSDGKNLILAIATPAAQSMAKATKDIPILVTAVTNPEGVGLVMSNQLPKTNVTGTSDLAPISKQIDLIKTLLPEAQNVGILYSSGEANSKYQADIAADECRKLNLTPQILNFSHMSEIEQVITAAKGKIDAFYTPTDNMVASNINLITKTARQLDIPLVCSDVNLVSKGSVGTYGIDYYELGKLTAAQAKEILENKKKPQEMAIQTAEEAKLVFNREIVDRLNLKIPEDLEKQAEFV
jgi:putative ABC transport system substrate-binding protein